MGSVNSRLGLRKSTKITHSDIEEKLENEVLENKTRQASKQPETHECTQAKSAARAKHNVEEMRMHEKDSAERILDMEAQIRQLKHENNQLLTRVSEIGAVRLLDNNPNLADLSDANRPEKLVEQFAEIYDNEWMYAFESLTGTNELQEEDAIKELLHILRVIYTECLSASRKHSERLKNAIVRYLGMSKQKDELVIKETVTRLREYRGKNPDLSITRIGKIIKKRLKGQIEDKVYVATEKYMQVCTRVCWLMCIKDPQMHLHFGDSPGNDPNHGVNQDVHIFNATQFVSYTKIGMYVKYVVWPALFLYKDGPIMKKGVAQGSHEKPTIHEITADNKDGDEYDNNVTFLGDTRQKHTVASDDGIYTAAKHQEVDHLSNYSTCDTKVKKRIKTSIDMSKSDVSGQTPMEYVITKENQTSFLRHQEQKMASVKELTGEKLGTQHEGKTSFNRELVDCTNNRLFNLDLTTIEFKNGEESNRNTYVGKHKKKKKSFYSSLKDKPSN